MSFGRMASTIDVGVAAAASVDQEIRELVESMVAASRYAENEEEEVTKMRRELVNAMLGCWAVGVSGDTTLHMEIMSRRGYSSKTGSTHHLYPHRK